ncbi:MAG: type IV conjugative transfer system lipoprotein TraV [Alphaproteobacteria bacterium]
MNIIALKLLALSALLSGCSTPNETFDCPAGQGVGCRSISKINQDIDNGSILKDESLKDASAEEGLQTRVSQTRGIAPVISQVADTRVFDISNPQEIILSDKSVIQRGREEHLRVWIAPHQDAEDNFHEGSVVHTIIRPSYWHFQQLQG